MDKKLTIDVSNIPSGVRTVDKEWNEHIDGLLEKCNREAHNEKENKYRYRFDKWDVDLIQEPQKLYNTLKKFNLRGRKIKSIGLAGFAFEPFESLQEIVYTWTDSEEASEYRNFKDNYEFSRSVEVDGVLLITFEDGDRLEIEYSDGSTLKIGLNSLPENVESGLLETNVDMNVMFSNCKGESITGFEISMQDTPELTYDFTGRFGYDLPDNLEAYISQLRILLTDHKAIVFSNFYDYGYIYIEKAGEMTKIRWGELKEGIVEK